MLKFEIFAELFKVVPGVTSIEEKYLSYNFIYEVCGKMLVIENSKKNLKVFQKFLMNIFGLLASFEAFWSSKNSFVLYLPLIVSTKI